MGGYHEHVWLDHVGIVLFGLPSVKHYKTYGHQPFVHRNSRWFAPRMSTDWWPPNGLGEWSAWWFQIFFMFHFIYGMSSFPLTNSIIFQRGWHHQPVIFARTNTYHAKKINPASVCTNLTSINHIKSIKNLVGALEHLLFFHKNRVENGRLKPPTSWPTHHGSAAQVYHETFF